MANSTTEQVQDSKDKKIMEGMPLRDLNEFLSEDDEGLTKRRRIMDTYYEVAVKDKDVRALKDFMDRDMGKPTEKIDITSGGNKVTAGLILYEPKDV